ncbi:hypothetical protein SHIRM173S_10480 [Streptomyces hirsutus]
MCRNASPLAGLGVEGALLEEGVDWGASGGLSTCPHACVRMTASGVVRGDRLGNPDLATSRTARGGRPTSLVTAVDRAPRSRSRPQPATTVPATSRRTAVPTRSSAPASRWRTRAARTSVRRRPVATRMWHNTEHGGANFAIPSMGAVLHTAEAAGSRPSSSCGSSTTPPTGPPRSTVPDPRRSPPGNRTVASLHPAVVARCTGPAPALTDGAALGYKCGCTFEYPIAGQPTASRGRAGRTGRGRHVLHLGHDRGPQGRGLQRPVDLPALDA